MLRLSLQEAELQEQSQATESLRLKLQRYEEELGERAGNETPPPPTTPPGLSLEEGAELQATIEQLEGEVSGVRAELAAKEEAERRLGEGEEGWGIYMYVHVAACMCVQVYSVMCMYNNVQC